VQKIFSTGISMFIFFSLCNYCEGSNKPALAKENLAIVFTTGWKIVEFRLDGKFKTLLSTKKLGYYVHSISYSSAKKEFALCCEKYGKGEYGIFIWKENMSEMILITSVFGKTSVSYSHDGSKIAFYDGTTSVSYTNNLYLLDVSTRDIALVCEDCVFSHAAYPVSWAPDDRAFTLGTAEGYVVIADYNGNSIRKFVRGDAPSWSPDGNRIAYREGQAGIRKEDDVIEFFVEGYKYFISFINQSKDKQILVNGKSSFWKFEGDFTDPVLWAPDGNYIFFYRFYEGLKHKNNAVLYAKEVLGVDELKLGILADMLPGQIICIKLDASQPAT